MARHVCKPFRVCVCWLLADSPNEDCPIHGWWLYLRCSCGRFVKRKIKK